MKKFCVIILLLSFVAGNGAMFGQEKKSKKERQQEQAEKIQKMVEARDYKFEAQSALPMSGRTVNLTAGYDLSVCKDTVTAYLPYFGRAYVAPMDNTQGGIRFESTSFEYEVENAKKGGWTIFITPTDGQKRYELILRITTSGSASLAVNDDTRQTISFNGNIRERKPLPPTPSPK